jgi:methionyl-tRNA formyltransferase
VTERAARTIFLGSGGFAVPIARRLAGQAGVELLAVVSAPPRRRTRSGAADHTPVSEWAEAAGLRTLRPPRLRAAEAIAQLSDLAPELLVLADYGQIVPLELLGLPRHGALNLHPSLLPRHRGASPIAAAILAGDAETGVSLMQMDAGLDTGPLLAQQRLALAGDETAPELEQRLAHLAAQLLADSLPAWLAGELQPRAQPAEGATLTRPLRRSDGRLDAARSARELERQVRAYQPWPGSFLETSLLRVVIWRARVLAGASQAEPGRLQAPADSVGRVALVTADGLLELLEVQPAGGRRMGAAELLRGRPQLLDATVL